MNGKNSGAGRKVDEGSREDHVEAVRAAQSRKDGDVRDNWTISTYNMQGRRPNDIYFFHV